MVTLVLSLPLLPILPLRPTFLVLGLTPFLLTHPTTQQLLPLIVNAVRKMHATSLQRIVDNDRLDDIVWSAPLKEVELWENERWALGSGTSTNAADAGWGKINLKRGERKGWSRRRDGWSDAEALSGTLDGDVQSVLFLFPLLFRLLYYSGSSNLTFTLEPGWHFVTTEDWRFDVAGSWVPNVGADRGE